MLLLQQGSVMHRREGRVETVVMRIRRRCRRGLQDTTRKKYMVIGLEFL